jgi:hypothetical protein
MFFKKNKIQSLMFTLTACAVLSAMSSFTARAESEPSSTTTSSADGKDLLPTVPVAEGVDEIITNNNLRALSGSTSRWSISSQFTYNGGTISSPLDQDRPDISGASGTTAKADVDGLISAKYNLDTKDSLLAGIGLRWIAPFSTGNLKAYTGSVFDVMNPYVTYQRVYKWMGIQSVLQVQALQWTQSDYTALGYAQQFTVSQQNMYEIGRSHVSVGAVAQVQYQLFDKSGSYGNPTASDFVADVGTEQSQYSVTVAPIVEYQLSDKVNLRTLVNVWTYEHYKADPSSTSFVHDTIYQSVGVGISMSRNVFLYPNVQFLPGQMEAQLTNLGVQATINLF